MSKDDHQGFPLLPGLVAWLVAWLVDWLVGWLVKGQRGENPGWMQICSQNVYRPQSLCCLWTFSISCPLSVRSGDNNPSAVESKHNHPEPVASFIVQGVVSHYCHPHHHHLSHHGDHCAADQETFCL